MLHIFKNKNPLFLLWIPILTGFLLFLRAEVSPSDPPEFQSLFAQEIFPEYSAAENPWIIFSVKFILLNTFLFFSLYFVNSKRFVLSNNFIPVFILLFVLAGLSAQPKFIEIFIISGLLTGSLFFLVSASEKTPAPYPYFNAALFFSTAALLEIKLIFFLILLPAAIIIFRQGAFREFWAAIAGMLLPWWLFYGSFFALTGSCGILSESFTGLSKIQYPDFSIFRYETAFLLYLPLLVIYSSFFVFSKFNSLNTDHRLHFILFFFAFLISTVLNILYADMWYVLYPFSAFLISIPLSFYFNNSRRKLIPEIVFDLLVLLIIFTHVSVNFKIIL